MWFFPFTTSLNFIFFYMTWATLVLSHSPLRVELVGTLAVRIIFYLLPSLLFFLFDILFPSVSVAIKARGELGLPTGSTKPARGLLGIGWKEAKVVAWSLCNLLVCGILAQGVVEHVLTKVLRYRSAIRVSLRLPYPWESVLDILRAFVVREFLTYIIHRFALHSPRSPVSRYHLSWYHSLRVPYPLTAHYDHPIPYLLLKVVPLYASAAAFRFHMTTYMLFVALVSLEETFAYSGYKTLPTGFFLGGVARRAEMHVIRNNGGGGGGNCYFGVWGVLDWLCGTTAPAVEDHEQQEEEDQLAEEDIDEKMIRKAIEEYRRLLREKKGNGNKTRRRRVNNNR